MDDSIKPVPHSGSALASRRKPEPISVEFHAFSKRAIRMPAQIWLALILIKVYQELVPDSLKRKCIYEPTCSRYAMMVIERDGLFAGIQSARARWLRCDASRFTPGLDLP